MNCKYFLCKKPLDETQTSFCSSKCKNKYHVNKTRYKHKRQLVELLGGKCQRCGYDKCMRALEFHHINPNNKSFSIAQKGSTMGIETKIAEVKKCVLLCSNCHAEIEHEKIIEADPDRAEF